MYYDYFGLTENPFGLNPNPEFFLNVGSYQDTLNVLTHAFENGDGFIKVVGEVGTGKTLLCRKLISTLNQNYKAIYITNPCLSADDLIRVIASELGVTDALTLSGQALNSSLTHALEASRSVGKRVIVLIDEAQAIPEATLETLRLLTNHETEKEKLLQVALIGQPELNVLLAPNHFRQLRQRFIYTLEIEPLSETEVANYVDHRLLVAGYQGPTIFSSEAVAVLHRASQGLPRLINVLAHKSLLIAFGENQKIVSALHVKRAAEDTESASKRLDLHAWKKPLIASAAVFVAAILVNLYILA